MEGLACTLACPCTGHRPAALTGSVQLLRNPGRVLIQHGPGKAVPRTALGAKQRSSTPSSALRPGAIIPPLHSPCQAPAYAILRGTSSRDVNRLWRSEWKVGRRLWVASSHCL